MGTEPAEAAASFLAQVSILIVTYNSRESIADTLQALPPEAEVILVDNCSSDGTDTFVETTFSTTVQLVRSGQNLGFARAVNIAAARASREFFLLLNPDAVISATSLASIVETLTKLPNVGIAAPLVIEGDGDFKTLAAGYEPSILRMFMHASGLSRLGRILKVFRGHYLLRGQTSLDGPEYVKWVSGGCMLVRRTTWSETGGLSERWFMYAEDVDFCLRAGDSGWAVAVFPWATARHTVGGSSNDSNGPVRTLWLQNLYDLFILRYRPSDAHAGAWRFVVGVGYEARALVMSIRALRKPEIVIDAKRFKAYAQAAWRLKGARRNDSQREQTPLG